MLHTSLHLLWVFCIFASSAPVKGIFLDLRFQKRLRYTCVFQERDLMDQQMVAGSECKDRACSNVGGISCINHVVTKNNIE